MTLPEPYYQDHACTIYHADCRDILPLVSKVDLVLTDPPYGIGGSVTGLRVNRRSKGDYGGQFEDTPEYIRNVVIPVVRESCERFSRVVLTPGIKCLFDYPAPAHVGSFQYPGSTTMSRWGPMLWQPILFYGKDPYPCTLKPDSRKNCIEIDRTTKHPCPKPYEHWAWLVARVSIDGETILDPFMGSGTTLRAAKDLGRRAIGIEINEEYCAIAVERLRQEVLGI